jgi:AcrR family transcriptional regulator
MVLTPWGDSSSLRERRLRPSRGTPRAEVEQNQRERLLAALVASVAERGYAATSINDLVEDSGVSSRTFYDLFGDMPRCMGALIEEIVGIALPGAAGTETADDLRTQADKRIEALAKGIAAQPATAKVCLNYAFAAGWPAMTPFLEATSGLEQELAAAYAASREQAGMPEQLVTARVGGIIELARTLLREGRETELLAAAGPLVELLLTDRPPIEELRLASRAPKRSGRESLEGFDYSDLAIRSFAMLVAEQGYQQTTVEDVAKRASMSSRTFYANFSGREDLTAAAIESACAQLLAVAMTTFSRFDEWPVAIRSTFGAVFNFLASRPALAEFLGAGVYEAGEVALGRRRAALAPLGALFEGPASRWNEFDLAVQEATAGGISWLVYVQLRKSGPLSLPKLAPISTYLVLAPLLGSQRATAVANGSRTEGYSP